MIYKNGAIRACFLGGNFCVFVIFVCFLSGFAHSFPAGLAHPLPFGKQHKSKEKRICVLISLYYNVMIFYRFEPFF